FSFHPTSEISARAHYRNHWGALQRAYNFTPLATSGVDRTRRIGCPGGRNRRVRSVVGCAGNVEHAMRAADLVIHAGGFGTVAVDLAEALPRQLQRIPPTAWFRFR